MKAKERMEKIKDEMETVLHKFNTEILEHDSDLRVILNHAKYFKQSLQVTIDCITKEL